MNNYNETVQAGLYTLWDNEYTKLLLRNSLYENLLRMFHLTTLDKRKRVYKKHDFLSQNATDLG